MIFQLFLAFSYLAIFVSGINSDTIFISILVSFLAVCFGLLYLLKSEEKIKFPKYFPLMCFFVLILQVYLLFIPDKLNPFYYAAMIGEGLLYWLIFYNHKNGDELLKSLLVWFSLAYSLLYFLSKIFNINLIKLAELFFQDGFIPGHYHIGDLWTFALIVVVCTRWNKIKLQSWLIAGLGFIFLVISNSRSALLSLILGFGYFFAKQTKFSKLGKISIISFFVLIIGMFIFSSLDKTTLFDRPYYLQSIESFAKYPLGVGMGNFKQIKKEFQQNDAREESLSIYTHNIFLETLSGVGIFSIIFLIFLIYLTRDILSENSENVVWGAVIIAILTNFMFDTSYTIPGLIWILFMAIGVFQSKERSLNSS